MIEGEEPTREKDGFSIQDWFGFDVYIAGVIAKACTMFRDHGLSYSSTCDSLEEWQAILTQIVHPLEDYIEAWHNSPENIDESYKQAVKAMHLFAENFGSMWD